VFLVTGRTGSGKTTTLYACLNNINKPDLKIITVEDTVEYQLAGINQVQVKESIGMSFGTALRAILRQAPNIVMIGEIRDLETANMAIQAALTGHLVISTLHTNDAPTAITRLLDLGVPAYMIKATVLGVMAQRLVRTLCPHCKAEEPPDREAWDLLVKPFRVRAPESFFAPQGCLECRDTGYLGRMGIYELLPLTDRVKELVTSDTDIEVVRQAGIREGMRTLRLSGAQKVGAGYTTISEVLRVAPIIQE